MDTKCIAVLTSLHILHIKKLHVGLVNHSSFKSLWFINKLSGRQRRPAGILKVPHHRDTPSVAFRLGGPSVARWPRSL